MFAKRACLFASLGTGGGRAAFPGHRLASRITSVCFPAGLESGRELHHGVQHHGQLPEQLLEPPAATEPVYL